MIATLISKAHEESFFKGYQMQQWANFHLFYKLIYVMNRCFTSEETPCKSGKCYFLRKRFSWIVAHIRRRRWLHPTLSISVGGVVYIRGWRCSHSEATWSTSRDGLSTYRCGVILINTCQTSNCPIICWRACLWSFFFRKHTKFDEKQ